MAKKLGDMMVIEHEGSKVAAIVTGVSDDGTLHLAVLLPGSADVFPKEIPAPVEVAPSAVVTDAPTSLRRG